MAACSHLLPNPSTFFSPHYSCSRRASNTVLLVAGGQHGVKRQGPALVGLVREVENLALLMQCDSWKKNEMDLFVQWTNWSHLETCKLSPSTQTRFQHYFCQLLRVGIWASPRGQQKPFRFPWSWSCCIACSEDFSKRLSIVSPALVFHFHWPGSWWGATSFPGSSVFPAQLVF